MAKGNRNVRIPTPKLPEHEKLRFSFEYYDKESEDYCLSNWNQKQIRDTLLRLQDINTKTFNDLNRERSTYHFGEVMWEKTIKKAGFPCKALNDLSAFHFALLGVNGQLARVYGAYSTGTFYVVWFDLNHQIWPVELKHT
ncbi:MAG: hypothetical protein UW64_C0016G0011 [Microgenomates group bacterium GW2011_GWC1_44_37]|uniref:Uncharacterized protein n=1 Tax=Candidatus Collierbacteria bacterium GW2011_GWB2_44_22 TaxID=1618387 RepID=A0A0G1HWP0_9BACT|nr:MAG: hypothetical protein UW31_C0006G0069 [Candidatus Collierbacteria bacterium GW2011_GWA2_44_13]KKT50047.1 MAG: hypothetical protein UW42_C0025G0009 [Candidatus Collierbacteria bacterium GW2011_GWB1_44_197]KKT51350.1 MAG: hypothetical protein UW44_C0013G0070 [Candidatus Collierbacteria bacterium GW2011_GWB2_44_22]KKT61472.1 MAG: hypothetical protein UW56_C0025G0009 [Candidatus Collierbacteria bacterium GW2011_GWD1_44_27]KKT65629.1 MAG: hypothetical protein UW58_C0024G0008 [Candidatus Colli